MMTSTDWIAAFPGLQQLEVDVARPLVEASKVVHMPAGTRIFGPGQAPEAYVLLLDGTVRVQQVSEAGREIVLYRVSAGESCALTTACLMGYEQYQAEGIAGQPVHADTFRRLVKDVAENILGRDANDFSCHSTRRPLAPHIYRATGGDVAQCAKLLGHATTNANLDFSWRCDRTGAGKRTRERTLTAKRRR